MDLQPKSLTFFYSKMRIIKDLKTCIKRLYRAEELLEEYSNTGGTMKIFTYLNLKGDNSLNLPKHPYLDYNEKEKKFFEQCFGKPLEIPKDLLRSTSISQFLEKIRERRKLCRECAAMTRHSRFRSRYYK